MCTANQFTGFYMKTTLAFNGLSYMHGPLLLYIMPGDNKISCILKQTKVTKVTCYHQALNV